MLSAKAIKAVTLWLILCLLANSMSALGQNEELAFRLLSEGKLLQAKKELQKITEQNLQNHDAQMALAWIDHWLGYQDAAIHRASNVLSHQPENIDAKALLDVIEYMRTPVVALGEEFQSDDQPLKRWNTNSALSWYRSNFLDIQLNFDHFTFLHDSSSSSAVTRLSNSFFEPHSRINFTAGVGVFNAQGNDLLWNLCLGRSLTKALYVEAEMRKLPYFYTLSSIQLHEATLSVRKGISISLDHKEKWLGKAVIESNNFAENEDVNTQYIWVVARVVHRAKFKLGVGYAFSHSHSDSLTFIPKVDQNGEYIPNPFGGLMGFYNPYFSPKNQSVHWAILSLELPLKQSIKWKARLSYGVLATADNPYLYEDLNSAGDKFVNFGYTNERYYPAEVETSLTFSIGKKLELQTTYFYQSLFFFEAQGGRLELKYRIGK